MAKMYIKIIFDLDHNSDFITFQVHLSFVASKQHYKHTIYFF